MAPLIHFRCSAVSHQDSGATGAQPGSPITWYQGSWAYCPSGRADGHEWAAVMPASLADLKRQKASSKDQRGKRTPTP
jgi:hypothetical protein